MYKKPEITVLSNTAEGVFMASGDTVTSRCRFGRDKASAGVDTCQVCSYTHGAYGDEKDVPEKSTYWYKEDGKNGHYYKEDFTVCPEGRQIKD